MPTRDHRSRSAGAQLTGGKYPPQRTAEFVEETPGLDPSKQQHRTPAKGSHPMAGIGSGVAYALARRRLGWAPQEYPGSAHARGFIGHLAFGLTAESVPGALDAAPEAPLRA